jgi:hypothetical protein
MLQREINRLVHPIGDGNDEEAVQLETVDDSFHVLQVVLAREVFANITAGHTEAAWVELNEPEPCCKSSYPGFQTRVLPDELHVIERAGQ